MKKLVVALIAVTVVFAATAQPAPVQYGVVGGGIHQVYGGGNGIASESYDWYVDWDWDSNFPLPLGTPGGNVSPLGFEGYILLALNPYTGWVWTDIPAEWQAYNPGSSYTGHAPSTMLPGGDYVSNEMPAPTGVSEDCIFITAEHRWAGWGGYFGAFIQSSPDGAIVSDGYDGEAFGVDHYYAKGHGVGDVIDAGSGAWIDGSLTDSFFGHIGAHNWMWYTGTASSGTTLGFEMDGGYGWMSLAFSGDRSGVRLNEYYFEPFVIPEPATMSLLALGGLAMLRRRRRK